MNLSMRPEHYPIPAADCTDSGWLPAPAKINLFLHIVSRLPNGYHELQSVFALVSAHDGVRIQVRTHDNEISRLDIAGGQPQLNLPADDLCVRAARLLQQTTGCTKGALIELDKQLPAQAGLGGGSSDAATTLIALNRLWNLNLPADRLMQLGLQLGADVPFFMGGQSAWVEGVGEKLTPLQLPAFDCVIAKPLAGVSTPAIFGDPSLKRDSRRATISGFVKQLNHSANHHALAGLEWGCNVMQEVAVKLEPSIGQCLEDLRHLGLAPRMTGSGSAVFALLPTGSQLSLSSLPSVHWWGCFQSLAVHPLAHWVPAASSGSSIC